MICRRVIDNFNNMPEKDVYIRGMRAWIGFKQVGFEYKRDKRIAGLGIIGEYVLRIFKQVKNRPRFIIDKIVNYDKKNSVNTK